MTDKEYAIFCVCKLRKEHKHQDIEIITYATTIGELQYVCALQTKEIRQLRKKTHHYSKIKESHRKKQHN